MRPQNQNAETLKETADKEMKPAIGSKAPSPIGGKQTSKPTRACNVSLRTLQDHVDSGHSLTRHQQLAFKITRVPQGTGAFVVTQVPHEQLHVRFDVSAQLTGCCTEVPELVAPLESACGKHEARPGTDAVEQQ